MIKLADKVGPYRGVSRDEILEFPEGRTFRLLLYGAYDSLGLIGSELNGLAILDEDKKAGLLDNLYVEDTGWYGPSLAQTNAFERVLAMPWLEFKAMVNAEPEKRYEI